MKAVATVGLVALVLASSGCGGSARQTGGVPAHVRDAIKARFSGADYLPSRLPKSYRYLGWSSGKAVYEIDFGPRPRQPALTFQVATGWQACGSFGSAMHTFEVNGEAVQWSGTYDDQQAWLCRDTKGRRFAIAGYAAVPGDDNLSTAQGRSDAERLADLVAYARPAS